jgi:hypothetical protein
MTTIQDLQDELRSHVRARIGRGELTGRELARNAEVPQGHLSNFLNSRRGLSLNSIDRLMGALGIGVLDLVRSEDAQRRMRSRRGGDGLERVALVAAQDAAQARFAPEQIRETRTFNRAYLQKLRARAAVDRGDWLRFVLLKLDGRTTGFFPPSVATTLLVDRHYSSLQPYRRFRPNLYVVSMGERCVAANISLCENCLMLRPREPRQPIEVIQIPRGKSYADYIVGRVCHVGLEV